LGEKNKTNKNEIEIKLTYVVQLDYTLYIQ